MNKNLRDIDGDYELWKLLSDTYQAIAKTRETELAQCEISGIQARTLLCILTSEEPTTPAQLSRWLFRESQSVSGLLDRMERQGLVKRIKDLNRKNQARIAITEKGRKAYAQSRKRKSIQNILSSLSAKEQRELKSYLLVLRDNALKELATLRHEMSPDYYAAFHPHHKISG